MMLQVSVYRSRRASLCVTVLLLHVGAFRLLICLQAEEAQTTNADSVDRKDTNEITVSSAGQWF